MVEYNRKHVLLLAVVSSSLLLSGMVMTQNIPLDFQSFEMADASSADATCDAFLAQNFTVSLIGNSSSNILIGTNGSDIMSGLGGNDIICGFGGNDTIDGGIGNDWIISGNGSDIIIGGNGTDACDGTTDDMSVTECELQLPEGSVIETFAVDSFEAVNALITSIQDSVTSLQNTVNTHSTIHDEVNRISTNADITGTSTYILQAICNPNNESKFAESELAIITNGTDTVSNDPDLETGNLTVSYSFMEVKNGIKIQVTNTNNMTGVTAEAYVTCGDFTN